MPPLHSNGRTIQYSLKEVDRNIFVFLAFFWGCGQNFGPQKVKSEPLGNWLVQIITNNISSLFIMFRNWLGHSQRHHACSYKFVEFGCLQL